jgi:hypothetical protein
MIDKREVVKAEETIAQYCQEQYPVCSECVFAHWYEDGNGDCFFDLYPHPSEWTAGRADDE